MGAVDRRRVGLVIGQLTAGGAEGQLVQLARALRESAYEPIVYCVSEKTLPLGPELESAGVTLRVIGGSDVLRPQRLARALRADAVRLIHSWLYLGNTYAWLARLIGGRTPLITSARNCKVQSAAHTFANRFAFRASKRIIVNSEEVGRYIVRRYGAPERRLAVIYNGVDIDRFRPSTPTDEATRLVVGIGRLVPQKNPELFLAAAVRVAAQNPSARFMFVGDGPLREPLAAAIRAAGLEERFSLPGETRDVPAVLRRAHLFWLTSAWEGLPNVVLEALASGVPVVATDVGGTRELFRSGTDGFLVAPGDVDGLVHYSCELLGRESTRREFSQRARTRALQFTTTRMVEAMIEVYDRATSSDAVASTRRKEDRMPFGAETEPISRNGQKTGLSPFPSLSVIIPIRNEAGSIGECLDSILQQDYPADQMEILVVDGCSDDDTRRIVGEYAERTGRVSLLDNPRRIVPSALNIGIRAARGDIIVRVDGHTTLGPGYLREGVSALQRSGADNVGGPMIARGGGPIGDAVALATSSKLGIGSYFHFGTEERLVDTVYMGMWPRSVFSRVGLFDEELVRNQDDEFNYRLRKMGGCVLLVPSMRSSYQNRGTLQTLGRQFYQYGLWKVRVCQKHPGQMSWRHLVPPAFVLLLLFTAVCWFVAPTIAWAGTAVVAVYAAGIAAASWQAGRRAAERNTRLLPLVFAAIHVSWGAGFLVGLVRFAPLWFRDEPAPPQLMAEHGTASWTTK